MFWNATYAQNLFPTETKFHKHFNNPELELESNKYDTDRH